MSSFLIQSDLVARAVRLKELISKSFNFLLSLDVVWLAQLVEALAALTHIRSCVQEVRVQSSELTSSTLASIPPE